MDIIKIVKSVFSKKFSLESPTRLAPSEQSAYRTKMNRLYKRENRRNRHHRIWVILQFMTSYSELMQCANFYQYKNATQNFNQAMGQMRKETIQSADIDTAIRFCRIEHHYGICQHKLTSAEIDQLRKWNNIIIDNHALLKDALCSYKQHWDSVLRACLKTIVNRSEFSERNNNSCDHEHFVG